MSLIPSSRFVKTLVIGIVASAVMTIRVDADDVVLKDGFLLKGYIKREAKTIIDPVVKEPVILHEGFFMITDLARRTIFGPSYVADVQEKDLKPEDAVRWDRVIVVPSNREIPVIRQALSATPWDEKWDRTWRFQTPTGTVAVNQHLAGLTPTFAQINMTTKFNWSLLYLTNELGPEEVGKLLAVHPDFQEKRKQAFKYQDQIMGVLAFGPQGGLFTAPFAGLQAEDLSLEERANRRLRLINFFIQAGWLDEAVVRLDAMEKDLPGQAAKVEAARTRLRNVWALLLLDEIRLARKTGRHEMAGRLMAAVPEKSLSERDLAELRVLRSTYETATANFKEAKRFLEELPKASGMSIELIQAAAAIRGEVSLDDFLQAGEREGAGRLDIFLTQARQSERQKAKNQTPDYDERRLLAFAVSGWLMGSTFAEAKTESAMKLWKARRFVLDVLSKPDADDRSFAIKKYEEDKKNALSAEEAAQVIPYLPPVDPDKTISGQPLETKTRLPGFKSENVDYALQLPPEYHSSRAYPVLLLLHEEVEPPLDLVRRWSALAGRHGYILAAPEWRSGWGDDKRFYEFTPAENKTVLYVLRDLKRRFNVDSDRVFLFGVGQGGVMAYDVGVNHPDLFAGVISMGGAPFYHATRCFRNAQYLPFYVVNGDHSGEFQHQNLEQFKIWIPRGYPTIYVQYKGRGAEWFGGELPTIIDWMSRKKRANPQTKLGKDGLGGSLGDEFCSLRPTDNHFYWLSFENLSRRCTLEDKKSWHGGVTTATLTGSIQGNVIYVRLYGIEDLTVWLGRGMVDFSKPVTITVNNHTAISRRPIGPKLDVLLGDLFERGDRQRLFLDKVVIDKKRL